MELDTAAVRRLREVLFREGRRRSLAPADPAHAALPGVDDPERAAMVERLAPIGEVLFLVVAADGVCDTREREAVRGALRLLSAGQLRSATIDAMQAGFEERLRSQGREARLQQVAAQLSGDREDANAALTAAAAIAIADGVVADAEREVLESLAEWLGLGRAPLD